VSVSSHYGSMGLVICPCTEASHSWRGIAHNIGKYCKASHQSSLSGSVPVVGCPNSGHHHKIHPVLWNSHLPNGCSQGSKAQRSACASQRSLHADGPLSPPGNPLQGCDEVCGLTVGLHMPCWSASNPLYENVQLEVTRHCHLMNPAMKTRIPSPTCISQGLYLAST